MERRKYKSGLKETKSKMNEKKRRHAVRQKEINIESKKERKIHRRTERWTDGWTDGRTERKNGRKNR